MPSSSHPTLSLPFSIRADLPNIPPLASYLLHLISIKRTNLCVSADVHSTSALLRLAEDIGEHICVLKTHADIIDDFSERTIRILNEISQRKHFLIFEDRKFGDIGSLLFNLPKLARETNYQAKGTVQSQYTRGPLSIAKWAHLTNAHLFPGPTIISALHSAATMTLTSINHTVSTEISTGTPSLSVDGSGNEDEEENGHEEDEKAGPATQSWISLSRKSSVVTATTTIVQTYEPSPPHPASFTRSLSANECISPKNREQALQNLGSPPHARGLLLLAEMSSEGNLMTANYTSACVSAARLHSEFVLGFISQHSLNSSTEDAFLNFTPGVILPPKDVEGIDGIDSSKGNRGDGLGQRWRSPREVIIDEGADVIIVGRGIITAKERWKEAERYRSAAWEAYEERIGRRNKEVDRP